MIMMKKKKIHFIVPGCNCWWWLQPYSWHIKSGCDHFTFLFWIATWNTSPLNDDGKDDDEDDEEGEENEETVVMQVVVEELENVDYDEESLVEWDGPALYGSRNWTSEKKVKLCWTPRVRSVTEESGNFKEMEFNEM